RDELEFARRYHQVVLSSLGTDGHAGVRDTISSNVHALDDILTRLDAERHVLADHTEVTVRAAELNRLKELSDHLGDTINKALGAILSGADRPATAGAHGATAVPAVRLGSPSAPAAAVWGRGTVLRHTAAVSEVTVA